MNPNYRTLRVWENVANSSYNGLQVSLKQQLSYGLQFRGNYTWSHSIDSGSTWHPSQTTANGFGGGDGFSTDQTLPQLDRGNSTYDIRHHWVAIVNYSIPWGENLKGVAHGFLAGWSLNANANVQSGLDFSISNSSSQTNVGGSDRPNLIGDPNLPSSQQTIQRWFNTSAFQIQAPLTPGNTPPGSMHGPWQRRIDFSLGKALAQHGSRSIQLRIEIYNIMNWANFQPPDGTFGATTFGTLFSTGNAVPRQFQFGIRYLF